MELIKICKFIHKFLIFETQSYGHTIETVLLCLTQLISCIRYLEKTIKIEQQELVELQVGPNTCFVVNIIINEFFLIQTLANASAFFGPYAMVFNTIAKYS